MTAETLSTFKLALSMRSSAPRIEAHYQHYATAIEPALSAENQDGCEHWWLYEGKQYCNVDINPATGDLRNTSQQRILPFDRVRGSGPRDLILYADITSPTFGDFHRAGQEIASKSDGAYRVRYKRSSTQSSEPLPVNGYGVELALKRTDYIVIDDRDTGGISQRLRESRKCWMRWRKSPISSPGEVRALFPGHEGRHLYHAKRLTLRHSAAAHPGLSSVFDLTRHP